MSSQNYFASGEPSSWNSGPHTNFGSTTPTSNEPLTTLSHSLAEPAAATRAASDTETRQNASRGVPRSRQAIPWDRHKSELRRLYLVDGLKLGEIMDKMRRDRSFVATRKQYKDRFDIWKWRKNLPAGTAQYMVLKAKQRKQGPGKKDTLFKFGDVHWTAERAEATVRRARKKMPEVIDMSTPDGVVYETPAHAGPQSPKTPVALQEDHDDVDKVMTLISDSSSEEWESDDDSNVVALPLTWHGQTSSDVLNLYLSAKQLARDGKIKRAETMFERAAHGYRYLLGPTHEDTNNVIVSFATFYVENDRLPMAYRIIEQSCHAHIQASGIHHRNTQQHLNNIVEMLNGWNRQDDALAFLARAHEIAEADHRSASSKSHPNRSMPSAGPSGQSLLQSAMQSVTESPGPSQLDYSLGVAGAYAATEGDTVERLLRLAINRCGSDCDALAVQRLKAWAGLLKLHNKRDQALLNYDEFSNAIGVFNEVMHRYPWGRQTRNHFERFRLLETALELVATFVCAHRLEDARPMFSRCEEKSIHAFGENDERLVWVLISIGLVYQRYRSWKEAEPWFQYALSIAMQVFDEKDGIRISLEEAIDASHFSYISDEGRPYKTIFGVSGLKIMPTRLHME